MRMRVQLPHHPSVEEVPYSDGFVVRGGVEIFIVGVDGETADPVVVAEEGVEVLAGLGQEDFDELIPPGCENK